MKAHPCQSRHLSGARCRRDGSFRGLGTVEIEARRAQRLADVQKDSPRHLATFRRAFEGKSLRAAVNAFCRECVGFEPGEVERCTAPACPLFTVRPRRA